VTSERQRPGRPADGITTGRVRRATPLAGMVARATGEAVVQRLRREAVGKPEKFARRAERYVELLGASKGALMKAGQMLSYVPFGNVLPEENRRIFQQAMSRLQADAPPMAPELAAEVIERELGAPPGRLFAEFAPLPFAAASIGQVHEARLYDGTRVAVKVQYPGVADAIRADLRNAELLAVVIQLFRSLVPGLTRIEPKEVAGEISARITEELDYRTEAANQRRFADAYRGHPFVRIPEVVDQLSTGRVLTQAYAAGRRWFDALDAPQPLRDAWAEVIYRFAFGSLRRLCLFNADPHPGNYMFHDDGTVSFLDFGCVKGFDRQQIEELRTVVRAVVEDDADALWHAFVRVGMFDAADAPTPEELLVWYRNPLKALVADQPVTLTPEFVSDSVRDTWSPLGPAANVLRKLNTEGDYVFQLRIDLGLMSVLGDLRATADWRAIAAEWDFGGPSATPMGEADATFWAATSELGLAEVSQ
jgi:predicted unusual protein kinase regulating ubiquinone biosynthesis (AarF/ABC1/UbiB family)